MGIDLINFLNRQISVPEAPTINDSRTRTYIPEFDDFGFDMPKELSPVLKDRLKKFGENFPHYGLSDEEVGTGRVMVDMSEQALSSAREYVEAAEKIGSNTVEMYELEQKHKENYLGYNNQVQSIDVKHAKALNSWQTKTDANVSTMRQRLAELKVRAQVA